MRNAVPLAGVSQTSRRSRWIPWIFVAGFGVVLVANGALILFSLTSWSGLETEQAYQKGLAYNQSLDAAAAQAARGWKTSLSFELGGALSGRLAVSFIDSSGAPVNGLKVTARLIRPTHEGFDHDVVLAHDGAGHYATSLDFPLAGQWQVKVEASGREAPYRLSGRIVVR